MTRFFFAEAEISVSQKKTAEECNASLAPSQRPSQIAGAIEPGLQYAHAPTSV